MTPAKAKHYRYRNEPQFFNLTKTLASWMEELDLSLSDITDAAVLAHELNQEHRLHEAMRDVGRPICVNGITCPDWLRKMRKTEADNAS